MRIRDARVGLRLGAGFGLIALLLLAVVGVALSGLSSQRTSENDLVAAQRAVETVLELKYEAADVNGRQTAYALDANRGNGTGLSDTSGTRKSFLDAVAKLRSQLAKVEANSDLDIHANQVQEISDAFNRYMQNDDRIVALYRTGTAPTRASANQLIAGDELSLYNTIARGAERLDSDVRAESKRLGTSAQHKLSTTRTTLLVAALIALVIATVLAVAITRTLTRPLRSTVDVLRDVARGDLRARLLDTSKDEVGQMGVALNETLVQMGETVEGIARSSTTLSSASEELSAVSQQMSSSAEETAVQASSVSVAAEQVSHNVQSVSAGAEELGASITEIAKNATEAALVASEAVRVAEQANNTVVKLGASSVEIGEVIKVITSIAEQTNLLALNATIEAARAGEVGKGFAVVAGEVKDLARKTATSSDEIGRKIGSIQEDTRDAVEAISQITEIILRINDIQTVIAAAVEEQAVTTNEIGRSVTEAATGASEIARNITGVAEAARGNTQGATETHRAAEELARLSAELLALVGRFTVGRDDASGLARR